jgi:hypothetical protein
MLNTSDKIIKHKTRFLNLAGNLGMCPKPAGSWAILPLQINGR